MILDHKTIRTNSSGYSDIKLQIKWLGYDKPIDLTWEKLKEMIEDIPYLVEDYFKNKGLQFEEHKSLNGLYKLIQMTSEKKAAALESNNQLDETESETYSSVDIQPSAMCKKE